MDDFATLARRLDPKVLEAILEAKRAENVMTWGYAENGDARVFELKPGERLPKGWSDRPAPGHHPNAPKA